MHSFDIGQHTVHINHTRFYIMPEPILSAIELPTTYLSFHFLPSPDNTSPFSSRFIHIYHSNYRYSGVKQRCQLSTCKHSCHGWRGWWQVCPTSNLCPANPRYIVYKFYANSPPLSWNPCIQMKMCSYYWVCKKPVYDFIDLFRNWKCHNNNLLLRNWENVLTMQKGMNMDIIDCAKSGK